ncbi:serine/threonine protein kinase [Streptomyces sp. NBC_01142]|uniref:serine/threonine protein kinase n=1 Tax=Streptomyces sp. NBC_01142 TaxID=2975865 RepID=UPI00224CD170|nr:serine/threonine protein kinase [Streptomyces sp. NBC_01142]MCX4818807.1 serine/threonine protein kinase [Streptomyces sp. NBC_01142]
MDDYAGRVLADRYRLPLPPSDEYELVETRAFDTYSGQEVLVRQVPLPEVVDAEVVDTDGSAGAAAPRGTQGNPGTQGRTTRRPADPAVRRAVEAAQAAAQIPDHPRLDQVFDVFAEGGSLWIVSERVAARPLAALLAEKVLSPYRAAEIASDVLTALRVLHAHGWTHRNITVRTVLVCDDGRVVLTGLASGAAEEALCGYAPVPEADYEAPDHEAPGHEVVDHEEVDDDDSAYDDSAYGESAYGESAYGESAYDESAYDESAYDEFGDRDHQVGTVPAARAALETTHSTEVEVALPGSGGGSGSGGGVPDVRAARAGAIAAYRAGARAAARVNEDQGQGGASGTAGGGPVQGGFDPDWWSRPATERHAGFDVHAAEDDDEDAEEDEFGDGASGGWRPGGTARLAGTWHDAPLPGRDGPGPVPAGGNTDPYGGELPYGYRRAAPDDAYGGRPTGPTGPAGPARPTRPASTARPALPAPAPAPAASAGPGSGPGARSSGGGSGSWERGAGGGEALRADAQRRPTVAEASAPTGRWDELVASGSTPEFRGPATPLAAERARQARIAVVGAVTERWAPEQAGPVHENWQLAAPVGPATDLWALGALLYRSVQGHAPYPEESAAELVQLVCAEPPAFAEECGPLRPVVESLLRQDPTERPDFEELRGWLRSLVRSAPEPEAGMDVVPLPSSAVDGTRLPVVRRRGELVRRKRRGGSAEVVHGRHRHKKTKGTRERRGSTKRAPRALGRTLLLLILLLLVAAVAYAVLFMPKSEQRQQEQPQGKGGTRPSAAGPSPDRTAPQSPDSPKTTPDPTRSPSEQEPQTSAPAKNLPHGYALRTDPEGFQIAVDKTWQRRPINDVGQVRYADGDFTLIVVPGRDSVTANGDDPLVYQRDKERELQPFRDSSWAGATGLRRVEIGQQVMAEGQFTWQDSNGREVYVRNLALIVKGSYHVIQVIGPEDQRDKVAEIYQQATTTYRAAR